MSSRLLPSELIESVNIPVGEVFTSPKLTGTNGVLHVSSVYLNGLEYKNLTISFKDGMIADYNCSNFDTEEENKRAKAEKEENEKRIKEKELLEKTYGESVKAIKDLLLEDKQKVRASKLKDQEKEEVLLVIDMLANVIESEDKDAITYAFIAYKYVVKAHKILFFKRVKTIDKLLKGVINEF